MSNPNPKLEAARQRLSIIRRKIEGRRAVIAKAGDELAELLRQEARYEAERKQIVRQEERRRAAAFDHAKHRRSSNHV